MWFNLASLGLNGGTYSLAFRLVAGAALWSSVALLVGGILLSSIFRQSVERSFDARLDVLLGSLIATTDVDPKGEITRTRDLNETRFDFAYSGWYWQIAPIADCRLPNASRCARARCLISRLIWSRAKTRRAIFPARVFLMQVDRTANICA